MSLRKSVSLTLEVSQKLNIEAEGHIPEPFVRGVGGVFVSVQVEDCQLLSSLGVCRYLAKPRRYAQEPSCEIET